MIKFWSWLWTAWKKVAHVIGVFQTRCLLTLFYFIVLFPVGILFRLFGHSRLKSVVPGWQPVVSPVASVADLTRQS